MGISQLPWGMLSALGGVLALGGWMFTQSPSTNNTQPSTTYKSSAHSTATSTLTTASSLPTPSSTASTATQPPSSASAEAAKPKPLWAALNNTTSDSAQAKTSQAVRLDTKALYKIQPGDKVQLPLLQADSVLDAKIEQVENYQDGRRQLRGVTQYGEPYTLVLNLGHTQHSGRIRTPENNYELAWQGDLGQLSLSVPQNSQ